MAWRCKKCGGEVELSVGFSLDISGQIKGVDNPGQYRCRGCGVVYNAKEHGLATLADWSYSKEKEM